MPFTSSYASYDSGTLSAGSSKTIVNLSGKGELDKIQLRWLNVGTTSFWIKITIDGEELLYLSGSGLIALCGDASPNISGGGAIIQLLHVDSGTNTYALSLKLNLRFNKTCKVEIENQGGSDMQYNILPIVHLWVR